MATKRGVYIQPPSGSKEHAMRPQIAIAVPSAEVAAKSHVLQRKECLCRLHMGLACNRSICLSHCLCMLHDHIFTTTSKSAPRLRPSVDSARTTKQGSLPLCYQTVVSRVLQLVQPHTHSLGQNSEGKSQLYRSAMKQPQAG